MPQTTSRHFDRSMRLSGSLAFARVYEAGMSRTRGPLKIFAMPNTLSKARLGLSVSRRVGSAPRRNQIKRRLRESFRMLEPAQRSSYDFIIVVRPHAALPLTAYHELLLDLFGRLSRALNERGQ